MRRAALAARWASHLQHDRRRSPHTVRAYVATAHRFIDFLGRYRGAAGRRARPHRPEVGRLARVPRPAPRRGPRRVFGRARAVGRPRVPQICRRAAGQPRAFAAHPRSAAAADPAASRLARGCARARRRCRRGRERPVDRRPRSCDPAVALRRRAAGRRGAVAERARGSDRSDAAGDGQEVEDEDRAGRGGGARGDRGLCAAMPLSAER